MLLNRLFSSLLIFLFVGKSVSNLASYKALCDSVFCRLIEESNEEISKFKETIQSGSCVPKFGQEADRICNSAIEKFSLAAPPGDEDKELEKIYDRKVEDLEKIIDAPLHVLYLQVKR